MILMAYGLGKELGKRQNNKSAAHEGRRKCEEIKGKVEKDRHHQCGDIGVVFEGFELDQDVIDKGNLKEDQSASNNFVG